MDSNIKEKEVFLSGMVCDCCKRLLILLLEKEEIPYISVEMGKITFPKDLDKTIITAFIKRNKFKQITDKNQILVNEIKVAIIELVHYSNNNNSIIRNSDYLVEKVGRSYQQLSSIFAEYENRTLEKYIIAHKIERTKTLIIKNEMSLSEIAFQMGYSSVQYLSNQFKKTTGITVSEFKKLEKPELLDLEKI